MSKLVTALLVCSLTSFAAATLSFEAASLKLHDPKAEWKPDGGARNYIAIGNVPLRGLIEIAYGVPQSLNVSTPYVVGPPWLKDVILDLVAKAPIPNPTPSDMSAMIRSLLEERMHLVAHMEPREMPIYSLTARKDGLKLVASPKADGHPGEGHCANRSSGTAGINRRECTHITMAVFITEISAMARPDVDRGVVDDTGLQGAWNFTVDWSPVDAINKGTASGRDIYSALQQLGLQLQAKRQAVPVVIVDSVDGAPSQN